MDKIAKGPRKRLSQLHHHLKKKEQRDMGERGKNLMNPKRNKMPLYNLSL